MHRGGEEGKREGRRKGREGGRVGFWPLVVFQLLASKYFFSFPAELGTFSRTIHNNQSRYSIL